MSHTPGPWRQHAHLTASENHKGFRVYGANSSGWSLAEVMPVDEDGKEGLANARLIAAAPDLLAALRDLRQRFHAACIAHGSDAWAADASCAKADSAIAKATGEGA